MTWMSNPMSPARLIITHAPLTFWRFVRHGEARLGGQMMIAAAVTLTLAAIIGGPDAPPTPIPAAQPISRPAVVAPAPVTPTLRDLTPRQSAAPARPVAPSIRAPALDDVLELDDLPTTPPVKP